MIYLYRMHGWPLLSQYTFCCAKLVTQLNRPFEKMTCKAQPENKGWWQCHSYIKQMNMAMKTIIFFFIKLKLQHFVCVVIFTKMFSIEAGPSINRITTWTFNLFFSSQYFWSLLSLKSLMLLGLCVWPSGFPGLKLRKRKLFCVESLFWSHYSCSKTRGKYISTKGRYWTK